jgi:RND family efflux transporter MFP subunit
LTLLGDVEAYTEGDVHSEVEGLAESFPVKEGDFVREGQVLARLNSSQLTLMLEKFRRDKEESRVLHEKEQSEFDRYKALSRSHSISHLQLEKEQSEADSTRFKMLMLETEIGRIEDRLSKMTIKAPFDGYVVQEYVHVGMWVTAGGKIVRMVEVDPIYVRVAFPQKDLPKLSLGQKAEVRIEGLGAARLPGKVSAIISKGEIASRTFPVKIELPNPGHRLKPGMLAYATFGLGKEHSALVVPKDAVVITPAQQKLLYVVENGKAKQVRVQTGQAYGSMIEVIGTGLKEGQQVVTVGNERLRPGVPVQIVGADTEGKPPSPLTQKTKLTGSPAK